MSTTPPSNQYHIRSLEQEIAFFDRKLAHLLNFETFPSEEDRKAAADRLSSKRERLVRTMKQLTEPAQATTARPLKKKTAAKSKTAASKSRPPKLSVVGKAEPALNEPAQSSEPPHHAGIEAQPAHRPASPFVGTSLDCEHEVDRYLQKRAKQTHA